jgi:hypothetical protein
MTTITVQCASCFSEIRAKESAFGKTLPCPKCHSPVKIDDGLPAPAPQEVDWNGQQTIPPPQQPAFKHREYTGMFLCQLTFVVCAVGFFLAGVASALSVVGLIAAPFLVFGGLLCLVGSFVIDFAIQVAKDLHKIASK